MTIRLKIIIHKNSMAESRNLVGDLKGCEKENEVVTMSSHIDSWDVGQGVQDDGVGLYSLVTASRLLKSLNLVPKRTLRTIFFTGEEMSNNGPPEYMKKYAHQLKGHIIMMEADLGCYKPMGWTYNRDPRIGCWLHEISKLIPNVKLTKYTNFQNVNYGLAEHLQNTSIPVALFNGNDGRYFWYHHTQGILFSSYRNYRIY